MTTSFSILGTIGASTKSTILAIHGSMQQTLLATFLVSGETPLTVDVLIEELWGPAPPSKAENALHAQVSRLRRSLKGADELADGTHRLLTTPAGYQFHLDPVELDAERFVAEATHVRSLIGTSWDDEGHLRDCVRKMRTLLAQWRGPIFGGLAGGWLCQTASTKYREARQSAQEFLYELEILTGSHSLMISQLTEAMARDPYHEKFCALLMVALYRSGRYNDALAMFRQFRDRMSADLGLEPSPDLRELERAVLSHNSGLADPIGHLHLLHGRSSIAPSGTVQAERQRVIGLTQGPLQPRRFPVGQLGV